MGGWIGLPVCVGVGECARVCNCCSFGTLPVFTPLTHHTYPIQRVSSVNMSALLVMTGFPRDYKAGPSTEEAVCPSRDPTGREGCCCRGTVREQEEELLLRDCLYCYYCYRNKLFVTHS